MAVASVTFWCCRIFTSHMAALQTQLLLPHQARPLADILLKYISTSRAGPHGTSVLPVTLLAVIEQVREALVLRARRFSCRAEAACVCVADSVAAGAAGCASCCCRYPIEITTKPQYQNLIMRAEGEDFVVVEDVEEVMAMP